jgi:hypothetical protein
VTKRVRVLVGAVLLAQAVVWLHAQTVRSTNAPDVSQVASRATVSAIDASTIAPQTIAAANTSRLGAIVYNDASAVLYLKYGTGASFDSYTVPVAAGATFVLPLPTYTGEIDGVWGTGASGTLYVTELTP